VRVRVIGGGAGLAEQMQQREDSADVQCDGELVLFSHAGNRESEADLLRDMIQAGHRVVEFGCYEMSLEDLFMQVTTGKVQ
jgi:ABC-2 type transport system ATP-binding protein